MRRLHRKKILPNANGFNEEPSVFNFQFNIGLIQFVGQKRKECHRKGPENLVYMVVTMTRWSMMTARVGPIGYNTKLNRSIHLSHHQSSKNGNAMRKTPTNAHGFCGCGLRNRAKPMLLVGFCNHNGCIDRVWIAGERTNWWCCWCVFGCFMHTHTHIHRKTLHSFDSGRCEITIFNSEMHAKRLVFFN